MTSLLEVLITFVSAMLILALIAQSVQELIKAIFAVKAATARKALERLLMESAQAAGFLPRAGKQVADAIVTRLAKLGQKGVRPNALRLDKLNAPLLGELIRSLEPASVAALKPLGEGRVAEDLDAIAVRAVHWFPLAMDPVDERYRRRMRMLSLVSAAIVVVSLNADAFGIIEKARHDPAFRERIQLLARQADSLDQRRRAEAAVNAAADSAARVDTTGGPANAVVTPRPHPVADSANAALLALLEPDQAPLFGGPWPPPAGKRLQWVIGLFASILLVSLGAPFWHDALESLFGIKNRIRAQADKAKSEVLPTVETVRTQQGSAGETEVKVTTKPVPELGR